MPDERKVNDYDPEDIGLKGIFGDRWHDETQNADKAPEPKKQSASTPAPEKPAQKQTAAPVAAQREPARPAPGVMDKLIDCAKHTTLFGGLSFLCFYWEQAGLMAESIAVPCMCVCTALLGLSVGKLLAGGGR